MEFSVSTESPERFPCDAIAAGIFQDGGLQGAGSRLDEALGKLVSQIIGEEGFEAKTGSTLVIHTHGRLPAKRVIIAGLGPQAAFDPDALRRAAAATAACAAGLHASHLALTPLTIPPHSAEALTQARVEGVILGAYRFTRYKPHRGGQVERTTLLADAAQRGQVESGLQRGRLFADATVFARDLVNEPPNEVTPGYVADLVTEIGRKVGLQPTVFDDAAMRERGMEAILAVGAGSAQTPRLGILEYSPPKPRRTVAIVGKGVTFDSGGLSLKTAEGMVTMKSDMAGGAAVLATMQALPALGAAVRVIGIVPAVENLPSGTATKPGDIIRAMNGITIEINNTDAEGRVILADALAYAAQQQPDEIIDLATLTGAAVVALGYQAAAVMGNDQALVHRVLDAAGRAGERMWQLPLYEEFLEDMRSQVADLRNSGGRYGGAEKGAIFLREFVGGRPWAHIDIAPVAFLDTKEGTGPYLSKGATGYGVRTLLTYLSG
ncbi:MAG TPA: leucyl aminopeptidase [bacterium]|jgi:leucyl aminopeptidase